MTQQYNTLMKVTPSAMTQMWSLSGSTRIISPLNVT